MSQGFTNSSIVNNPVGSMQMFAGATAPSGYLICDGSAISRATYSKLFAVVGEAFGAGDSSTTFNIPDMQGAAPAGVGTSSGYNNNESVALGSKYNDSLQDHTHGTPNVLVPYNSGNGALNYNTSLADAVIWQAGGTSTGASTGAATVTKGKTVGVNFIIKY